MLITNVNNVLFIRIYLKNIRKILNYGRINIRYDIYFYLYYFQETLLNSLTAQDCEKKTKEKLMKTKKKMEKEIKLLEGLKQEQEEKRKKEQDMIIKNLLTSAPGN